MFDPSYLQIIEMVVSGLIGALMWQVWNLRQALTKIAKEANDAKENSWQLLQDFKVLAAEVSRLREEHKEIQGQQMRADENLNKFAEAVSNKVETIMRDHSEHEVGQAKIEAKLEELIRKS